MPEILDSSRAFDPGHALWIIPQDSQSHWYQRLNWLTNFQLTANELHIRPQMHPWLIKIIQTCGINPPEIPLAEPLLVPVGQWLPADWLIMLPIQGLSHNDYIQKIHSLWIQLQRPSLRIFAPKIYPREHFETKWRSIFGEAEASFVFEAL